MSHEPIEVEAAFAAMPAGAGQAMTGIRRMIFEVGADVAPGAKVTASLKWGQPSYRLTPAAGTPLRLGVVEGGTPAIFVHCATSVVADWSEAGGEGRTIGGRCFVVDPKAPRQTRAFIRAAMTYRTGGRRRGHT